MATKAGGSSLVEINEIERRKPFDGLFNIEDETLFTIQEDMEKNGFDKAFPVALWRKNKDRKKHVCLDGHTRLMAAEAVGKRKSVPCVFKTFETEEEALAYAIANQRNRRNITEQEIVEYIEKNEKVDSVGGKRKAGQKKEASAKQTAKALGTSVSKVNRARKVVKEGKAEEVKSKKKTVDQSYKDIKKKEKQTPKTKSKFLKAGKGVDFANWIWSILPEDEAALTLLKKAVAKPDSPMEERIVVLTGDLMQKANKKPFVQSVINAMNETPDIFFMVCTTQAARLKEFDWNQTGDNIFLGVKVSTPAQVTTSSKVLVNKKLNGGTNFVIASSLDKYLDLKKLYSAKTGIRWLILGAAEGLSWEDVFRMYAEANDKGVFVYMLPSVQVSSKEFPE